ncbi:hypothetical protein COBT_002150 [Conglomerata obtusa]
MRPVLIKFSYNDGEWYSFVREAKQNSWIAFTQDIECLAEKIPDNNYVNEIKKKYKPFNKQKNSQKNCILHGWGSHNTKECRLMDEAKKRGVKVYANNKNVNLINKETDEDEYLDKNINKESNSYSLINNFNSKNKFLMQLNSKNGKTHPALLDTGADISLISRNNLFFKNQIDNNSNVKISTANGTQIPTLGRAKVEICSNDEDKNHQTTIYPYVTNLQMSKTILGRDFIEKNLHILSNIINNCVKLPIDYSENDSLNINEIKHNDLSLNFKKKHSYAFKEELDPTTLCSIGIHNIETKKPDKLINKILEFQSI